jgi:chromosome segregation ATPase
MPPKPKSAKELPSHTEDLRESMSKLQSECDCLKELLKVEIKKSDASNKLIDSLVSALEEVNSSSSSHNELDETLLLEGIDKDDTIDRITHRNAELEKEVATLHSVIEQLKIENKNLQKSN